MSSIEQKGFAFTRTMLDNSSEITRLINTAGEAASNNVTRTLNELNDTAQKAIAQSKETATATVSEMLETHNMLRSDTTALFERLREANIMLQEVLSGSHENMSALENTLMLRVSEFVTAMNEVTGSTGEATDRVENNITNFRDITSHVITDLGQLANQFDVARPRSRQGRRADRPQQPAHRRRRQRAPRAARLAGRHARHPHRGHRAAAQALLRPARRVARGRLHPRARSRPRGVGVERRRHPRASPSNTSACARTPRTSAAAPPRAMRAIYEQSAGDTQAMFRDANERFAETVQGMKQMAAEMQRELEATRTELRRGVFELPQETAESAAQMRRVIVDQIEALAELNRIVARHGRNLDAVEPVRRRARSRRSPSSAAAASSRRRRARTRRRGRAAAHRGRQLRAGRAPRRSAGAQPGAATPPAAAGSAICSPAPRARKPSRRANSRASQPREPVREASREPARAAARAGRAHAASLASSRSIRCRSTSPA